MKSVVFSRLDLRLMFSRQPLLGWLLGVLVLFSVGGVLQAPSDRQPVSANNVDPARIAAAKRSFEAILVPAGDLDRVQQSILDAAASHQLTVGRVEYEQESNSGARFVRASMSLPLSGRYTDIRAFIESSMSTQPALSIRHLSIRRETSGEESTGLVVATLLVQFLVGGR